MARKKRAGRRGAAKSKKSTRPASPIPLPEEPEEPAYSGPDYFTQLPVELLMTIAKYGHMDAIRRIEHPVPNIAESSYVKPVFSLAAVSQRLRSIVVREPSFWSYIRIDASTTEDEVVIACLERSKGHPLTILWIGERDTAGGPESSILDIIVQHSQRWISFAIVAPTATYLRLMFMDGPFGCVEAPMLRKLYVANTDGDEEYFGVDLFDFPSIQHVQIYQYPFGAIGTTMTTLTRLEANSPDGGHFGFEELCSIAKDFTRLEYLSLSNGVEFDSYREYGWTKEQCDGLITWASLRELVIETDDEIWRYLKLFRAPRLQKFVAVGPGSRDFQASGADTSRILANMPSVKEVCLLNPYIGEDSARQLTALFPKITHLSLCHQKDSGIKPSFGPLFHPGGLSDIWTWPNLESITLGEFQGEAVVQSIIDCLQCRDDGGRGVSKIFIPRDQPDMARELWAVRADVRVADHIPTYSDYNLQPRGQRRRGS
ncbi:hypothetical protein BDN72DRAFT_294399 [Pluteus cervinus]|uniref:Uncharacterized protein n=1 Tax=Pluteus cervinus TaxID=181527 RepID=A0ACD3B4Z6_9AGAR|nr:hypothetical protein BDN72DRAFT_294399 [Pluteus cervinus]